MNPATLGIAALVVALVLALLAVWELIRLVAAAEPGDMCDTDDPCTSCVSPQLCAETGDCWAHVFHFDTVHIDTWVKPKDTEQ